MPAFAPRRLTTLLGELRLGKSVDTIATLRPAERRPAVRPVGLASEVESKSSARWAVPRLRLGVAFLIHILAAAPQVHAPLASTGVYCRLNLPQIGIRLAKGRSDEASCLLRNRWPRASSPSLAE
jgi:hypothetical protein